MNNILSIDFGERYLGFAVRTQKTGIPIPLKVVDSKKDETLTVVKKYVEEYKIKLIVIGYLQSDWLVQDLGLISYPVLDLYYCNDF